MCQTAKNCTLPDMGGIWLHGTAKDRAFANVEAGITSLTVIQVEYCYDHSFLS